MGIFSKGSATQEPSFSRAWIAQNGAGSRKVGVSLAIINRLVDDPVAAGFGRSLDDGSFDGPRTVAATALAQERSLAGHVARDLCLMFETVGGLATNSGHAMGALGLEPGGAAPGGATSRTASLTQLGLSIARTIRHRYEHREPSSSDLATYQQLFEDASEAGHQRALDAAAWASVVIVRLRAAGHLPGEFAAINPNARHLAAMSDVGWYPNPINAGDTSNGDAQIERWWDGADWTDRVRRRDGRSWQELRSSMYTTPSN